MLVTFFLRFFASQVHEVSKNYFPHHRIGTCKSWRVCFFHGPTLKRCCFSEIDQISTPKPQHTILKISNRNRVRLVFIFHGFLEPTSKRSLPVSCYESNRQLILAVWKNHGTELKLLATSL